MQPPKFMRMIVQLIAPLIFGVVSSLAAAQAPLVLSAQGSLFVFELAATPEMARHLTQATTAKLATPSQHTERGLTYPLWLSDANFSVKTRAGQRQSVVVEAKRGNPELSTDLLLALNNKGVRTLEPNTLIFDKLSTFSGAAMPPANQATQPDLSSGFASALKTTAPIDFSAPSATQAPAPTPKQIVSTTTSHPVSSPSTENHVNVSLPPISSQSAAYKPQTPTLTAKANRKPNAPEPAAASSPRATTSQAIPVVALEASMPTAQTVSDLQPAFPARSVNPTPSKPTQAQTTANWMADWPMLAGATAGLLLLVYLAFRVIKNRTKSSQFSPTLSPAGLAANTVFGLSDEDAEAMRKKWLADQILQKSNK